MAELAHSEPVPRGQPIGKHACLCVLLLLACLAQAAPVHLTDDRGRTTDLAAPPQRVVSLLPSLTETVCELQQCHRLVGVDRYSNWPAMVKRLPQLGGGLDPNIEAIVALRPDVVLMAKSSRTADRLESLGLRVVALETETHADAQRAMHRLGQLFGLPQAASSRVWQRIDTAVAAAALSLPASARGLRVYFEVNRAPYAAGESSFIGETLSRLGVRNIVPASLGPFPKLNPEYVVRADPDLIMVGERNADGISSRPGWQHLRAVREQRICVFPQEVADSIVRPGPRLAEGAQHLAECLRAKAASAAATGAAGAAR